MTVNKTTWSPKERQQYEALLAEVVAHSKDTAKRMDLFEKRIAEARKANKTWARDCERAAMREYAASEIKLYQDRIRAMVAHDGRILNVPKVQDRRVRDTSGGVVHQRELIELFTWDQILAKRLTDLRSQRHFSDRVAAWDKLLALRDLCPDASTPAEAARLLCISLDDYLADVGGIAAVAS